jgi:hypothetical protein
MAQYLLAVYYDDRKFPPEEFQQLCVDVPALDAKMEDAGVFVFHGGVLPPESATVVRQSGGDFLITDGPYMETKEHRRRRPGRGPGVGQARHGRVPATSRGRPVRNARHRPTAGGERGRRAVIMSVQRP